MSEYSLIQYSDFKLLRSNENSAFTSHIDSGRIVLRSSLSGVKAQAEIDLVKKNGESLCDQDNYDDYTSNLAPFANKPIDIQEIRFRTHDFSNKADWDGRTHGDQVAYLAGGVAKHPIDGSWLDSTGAAMLAAYADPQDPNYGDPNYLFGSLQHKITSTYNDVDYKWVDSEGDRIVYLDTAVSPCVWKLDNGTTVVHYDSQAGDWIRNDNSAVVTSSLWRILPYSGYKIQINKAILQADVTATFTGTLHYQVYMDLPAGVAGTGYPAGNYPVKDWTYGSISEFQGGADSSPYLEPITRTNHSGPIITLSFDYKTSSMPQVVDSQKNMHLDIFLSNHAPVQNSLGARATFVCLKIRSF